MPLPPGGGAWPPQDLDPVTARLNVWSAWYSGDPDRLSAIYGGTLAGDPGQPLGTYDRNLRGWRGWLGKLAARWFWGMPTPQNEKRTKLHLPLAGDIAATSADLLFSEPPTFRVDDKAAQARLDELIDGMHADLLEAAEICAGLGGVYLRVCWDKDLRDRPWIGAVHADAAIPEWRWGRLTAVTLWRVVHEDGNEIWRHLERHEPGQILHGLYKGSADDLGKAQQLAAHEATKGLRPVVTTGIKQLTAVYVPNMRPARVWRDIPQGAHLGRADIAGCESLMDALDETYSSLMRDIRLAKARLIIPEAYLQSSGKGEGATWDSEQEFYSTVNALVQPGQTGGLALTPVQFEIRVEEHLRSAQELQDKIVLTAGYSTQTFGEQGAEGAQQTATEVSARQRRSLITRDRKSMYWTAGLADLAEALLAIDAAVFKSGVKPERPTVEFAAGVSEDPAVLAQTAQLLRAAEAASTETLVQMVHPEWDEPQVREEVARIRDERPDVMDVPGPGAGMGPGETGPGAQPAGPEREPDRQGQGADE